MLGLTDRVKEEEDALRELLFTVRSEPGLYYDRPVQGAADEEGSVETDEETPENQDDAQLDKEEQ
jgi:hypothetical protein